MSPDNVNKYIGKQMMAIACLYALGAFPGTDIWMPFTRLFVMSYCGLLTRANSKPTGQSYIGDNWIDPVGKAIDDKNLISYVRIKRDTQTLEFGYQLNDNGRKVATALQSLWTQQTGLKASSIVYGSELIESIKIIIPVVYDRTQDKQPYVKFIVPLCRQQLGMAPMQMCLIVTLNYNNFQASNITLNALVNEFMGFRVSNDDGEPLSWWNDVANNMNQQGLLAVGGEGDGLERTVALTDKGRQIARALAEEFCKSIGLPVPPEAPAAASEAPAERSDIILTDAEERLCALLKMHGNIVLHGAPGTGKTYTARRIASHLCEDDPDTGVQFVQFHQSYDYTDFVEGLRPCGISDDGQLRFERRNGIFMEFCQRAAADPEYDFVFIIDEINRGELSRIFGELFFSIDPDYRGEQGRVMTQYSNMWTDEEGSPFRKGFYVPENLYIIATMNDIDRSVESMDFAIRRRFVFHEITAADSKVMLHNLGEEDDDLYKMACAKMDGLNAAIAEIAALGPQYQIGGAYFLKITRYLGENGEAQDPWAQLWEHHLCGLLREYLRGLQDAGDVQRTLADLKKAYDGDVPASLGETS